MISFLVAMDRNRVIGNNGGMPWHLPADLAYFKKTTTGHTIMMGRRTYESIGKPLPNRQNMILTRNENYIANGCVVVHSIHEAMSFVKSEEEVFVIGGAQLFETFLPSANRLYITCINAAFEGDTYFPDINMNNWEQISKKESLKDKKNPYDHVFLIYDRK